MNKYGRAGVALLGIVALGGLVSLLGGPNVFSTFSSSISTLFPESDAPVTPTESEKTQDETPVANEPELQDIEEEIPASKTEPTPIEQQVVSTPEPVEQATQSSWVSDQPSPMPIAEEPRGQVLEQPVETPPKGPSETPRRPYRGYPWRRTSDAVFRKRYHSKAPGSTGTGKWCVTVSGVRELKENEHCS